ncbi:hypothetical protein AUK04_02220 [Candidatus Roizmanbacteria bacterium CG2_30_33_16]|uniref:Uncharacterized protein n=1 Tax=Candidatus Roizmanbacteria bacterium CG2_30_33_16 TaxID=1805340 RepID=A0A1J5HJF9_9BACT|nr:MAG: hypothetical protein AUK04_02220 [Candidatus Roizmanbacteria bacterium CG2_30_33_16]
MEAPDNFEQGKTPNLEVETLDPTTILITEHNVLKRRDKEIFGDTFDRLRIALDSGKISDIPPIVVFQNPFVSIEDTVEAYQNYIKVYPRQGGQHYDHEDDVLKEVLGRNALLCYNGNRRLEEFQRAKIPIRAYVIKSQNEFSQIPPEEKRIPEGVKDERPAQYKIDQEYQLAYLALLDDVVYILAEKRHWDNFDPSKLIEHLRESRKKR